MLSLYTYFMLSYWGLVFLFLTSDLFTAMFVNYHYAGHWILLVTTILCFVLPK